MANEILSTYSFGGKLIKSSKLSPLQSGINNERNKKKMHCFGSSTLSIFFPVLFCTIPYLKRATFREQ